MTSEDKIKDMKEGQKKLKTYQLAGMGVGGVIGAGYFLGCGLAVREAGPSVVLSYLLGGLIMMQVLGAMTSINVNRLTHGSFRVYIEQFLGKYFGFLLGWIVFTNGIFALASEALAMAVFIRYWITALSIPVLAIGFTLLVIMVNSFGVTNMGRLEALMAALKVAALILFVIVGGYFVLSGNIHSNSTFNLSYGMLFPKGIMGVIQSMLIVIFSYSGISAIVMASTEVENPRLGIHRATIYMSLGIVLIYFLSMITLVGILPWREISTDKSPFVQAFQAIGLYWASSMVNIIILIAAFSVMIATYYANIHMLVSLADSKAAPGILTKVTKDGLHINSLILVGVLSLLLVALSFFVSQKLFNYLVSACSYFTFLNWILNLITYLVWLKRKAINEEYQSPLIFGKNGAYVTLTAIVFLLAMSLGVADFRTGFYSASIIALIISGVYAFLTKFNIRND